MIHSGNPFDKIPKAECNPDIKVTSKEVSLIQDKITCLECLKNIIEEWENQISYMTGQPLMNAQNGLKGAKERLKFVLSQVGER